MSREKLDQGIDTHQAILDTLRARDLDTARRLLEFHLSHYLDGVPANHEDRPRPRPLSDRNC